MELKIVKTNDGTLEKTVRDALSWATTINIGVAYATYSAYKLFKKDFEQFLRRDGKIRALFDVEKLITDKQLIEEFATMPGDCECKFFLKSHHTTNNNFHSKLYLFYNEERYSVIVGSSNFTLNGFKSNIETNVNILNEKDDFFNLLKSHFQEIWMLKYAFNALENYELLDEYKQFRSKNLVEDKKKRKNLAPSREQLTKKLNEILAARRLAIGIHNHTKTLNEDFIYLLGLLMANGEFNDKEQCLNIYLKRGISNRNKEYEGFYYNPSVSNYKISQEKAHERDVERIFERLLDLLIKYSPKDDINYIILKRLHYKITIHLTNESPLWNELKKYQLTLQDKKIVPIVPIHLLNSENQTLIKAFLRGYIDLKSRITVSDGIYNKTKNTYSSLRMGLSISKKHPEFMKNLVQLFYKIGIDKGLSATDPQKRKRELLIRIDVRKIPYDLLGTHWKRIFLGDFQYYLNNNRKKYNPS